MLGLVTDTVQYNQCSALVLLISVSQCACAMGSTGQTGDIEAFLADTRSCSFIHACMIELSAAARLVQQGPAAQIRAGDFVV
jgi:hypothetical protein